MSPWVAWNGEGAGVSPWPSRVEAVESAFAIHAAAQESTVGDLLDALAKGKRGS